MSFGTPQISLNDIATRQISQAYPIEQGGIPCLPSQASSYPPQVQQFLPSLVQDAVSIIQQRASENVIRMFFFNLMADNGYKNQHFDELLGNIVTYLVFLMSSGRIHDFDSNRYQAAVKVIDVEAANKARTVNGLFQMVPLEIRNNIQNACNEYDQIGQAIGNWKNQQNQNQQRGGLSMMGGGVGGAVMGTLSAAPSLFSGASTPTLHVANNPSSTQQARFGGTVDSPLMRAPTISSPPKELATPVLTVAPLITSETETAMHPMKDADTVWKPSEIYPYPPVITYKEKLAFTINDTGVVVPVVTKSENMDFEKHQASIFGEPNRMAARFLSGEDIQMENERLQVAQSKKVETETPLAESDDAKPRPMATKFYEKRKTTAGFDLDTLVLWGNMQRIKHQKQAQATSLPDIYRIDAAKVKVFVSTKNNQGYFDKLRAARSYSEVLSAMRMQPDVNLDSPLQLEVDNYLTEQINSILVQKLSILKPRMGSFVDDYLKLVEYLNEKFGQAFGDGIAVNGEAELRRIFGESAFASEAVKALVEEDTDEDISTFVVSTDVSLLYLNVLSHDLGINMVRNVASELVPEHTRVLHSIVSEVLTSRANTFGHFYLITNDMRVLEVSRGYLGRDSVVMRLIK